YYLKNIPELKTRADAYEKETGIRLDLVSFATTAEKTMAGIPPDAQAVYITPSVIMDDAELGRLIGFINARKLPSFSMMGEIDVEQGVLAGQRSGDPIRIIRRLALNIQQILLGASPETLPVVMDDPLRTVLNARTARQIGVDLPYALLLTAQIIHSDELEIGKPLNLSQAYQMALESNPAITGGREEVKKSEEDRLRARSSLFPQVNGNLQYAQIDEDRARSSMGLQPWKSKTGGFGLTQIIFNDPAISGFRAYSRLYQSKRFEQTNLELDTLTRVGEAYINLLTRRALLQIDIDNYGLIQNYLDLAKNRYKSGVAGPEEIYRWETQLTSARSSLLNSQAQLSIAQTLLNQTLGTDMNALWNPADEQQLVESNPFFAPRFTDLINSDRQFDALRTFLRHYALRNAPELQALDFAIEAQEITLNQYKRRFIAPTVGVSLDYDHSFDQTMASTDEPSPFSTSGADDNNWTAALVASWPLFEGGGKASDVRKAQAEVNRLRELRVQTEQAVIQRLYEALYSTSGSSPSIALTQQAVEFARKNLQVIQEKYAQGTVSIIDLLDAQNEVFQQEQRAALAKYQFMLDIIKAQRATAWIPELHSAEERTLWLNELNTTVQMVSEDTP
ncbi:MAG: TolC family protein, partial [Kiritimatiellae bacterium]|nr:TolC family protein [Kiritimatiellia bacterium]